MRTIHNAKRKAEQIFEKPIVFEHLEDYGIPAEAKLYTTLLKAYQKQKTEMVENIQNLIFVYIKNWFLEVPCAAIDAQADKKDLPKVSLHDWLE